MELGERTRSGGFAAIVVGVFLLGALVLGFAPAGATPAAPSQNTPASNISVNFTPSNANSAFCLPPFLAMRHSTSSDAQTFRLRINVTNRICNRVDAVAVIYAMPGRGVAWPQNFVESLGFSLQRPGVTEVVFTKGCNPVQFDVVTGATPPTISPLGPWHGPLLFPFDVNSSLQWWGCGPTSTTTTTTTPTSTTTTIADNCEDYTPSGVAVTPSTTPAGQAVLVSGTGTPGTMIQVVLRPAGTGPGTVSALSNPVQVLPDGTWSTPLDIPSTAEPGEWLVAAHAVDCDTEAIADLTIEPGGTATTSAPTTEPPVVAGESVVNELPAEAVVLGNAQSRAADAADKGGASLAFTGAGARIPVIIAVSMIAAGGLLLLKSRRRTA